MSESDLVAVTDSQSAVPDTDQTVLVSGEQNVPAAQHLEDAHLVSGGDCLEDRLALQAPDEEVVLSSVLVCTAEGGPVLPEYPH